MTTNNEDIVIRCMKQLKGHLQSIATLGDKTLMVYSGEELLAKSVHAVPPCGGVVYEGMRGLNQNGGLSGEGVFTLLVMTKGHKLSTEDQKATSLQILGELRQKIVRTPAPSGHKWRFILEAPAEEKGDMLIWAQRWIVPLSVV